MFCLRTLRRNSVSAPVRLILQATYSRRSNDSMSPCVVNYGQESFKNLYNAVRDYDPNWELLMPAGYRFYLPGSVGHGWSDVASTVRMELYSKVIGTLESDRYRRKRRSAVRTTMFCKAQQCPKLLRKDVRDLFPAWLEVMFRELTVVTIIQKPRTRTKRWSKELEVEKLAQNFVLSASYICVQLGTARHWADFVNPFSGRPHMGEQRTTGMLASDEHTKCFDFKIEDRNNCKIISRKQRDANFVGSLYTTAAADSAFLRELIKNISEHKKCARSMRVTDD